MRPSRPPDSTVVVGTSDVVDDVVDACSLEIVTIVVVAGVLDVLVGLDVTAMVTGGCVGGVVRIAVVRVDSTLG
jgi:hypothetical protein